MLKKNILTDIKKNISIFIVTWRMLKTWASPINKRRIWRQKPCKQPLLLLELGTEVAPSPLTYPVLESVSTCAIFFLNI